MDTVDMQSGFLRFAKDKDLLDYSTLEDIIFCSESKFGLFDLDEDSFEMPAIGKCGAYVIAHWIACDAKTTSNFEALGARLTSAILDSYFRIVFPSVSDAASVLFALSFAAVENSIETMKGHIDTVMSHIVNDKRICSFTRPDVANGNAGLLFSLIHWSHKFGSQRCLKTIDAVARRLLDQADLVDGGLVWKYHVEQSLYESHPRGYLDGSSGIAWVLYLCGHFLNRPVFIEASKMALANKSPNDVDEYYDARLTSEQALKFMTKIFKRNDTDWTKASQLKKVRNIGVEFKLIQSFINQKRRNHNGHHESLDSISEEQLRFEFLCDNLFNELPYSHSNLLSYILLLESQKIISDNADISNLDLSSHGFEDGEIKYSLLSRRYPVTCYLLDADKCRSLCDRTTLASIIQDFEMLAKKHERRGKGAYESFRFESDRHRVSERIKDYVDSWLCELKSYRYSKAVLGKRGSFFWEAEYQLDPAVSVFRGTVDWPLLTQYIERKDELTVSHILSNKQEVTILSKYSYENIETLSFCLNEWEFIINGYIEGATANELLLELCQHNEISQIYSHKKLAKIVEEITKKYLYHGFICQRVKHVG